MRKLLTRIALTLGGTAVLLSATGFGASSTCAPESCNRSCPMHQAQAAKPEPPKSCCAHKKAAEKPSVCQCKKKESTNASATIPSFNKFELPLAAMPHQSIVAPSATLIPSAVRIDLHNHGPPGDIVSSPSIPRAPPIEA